MPRYHFLLMLIAVVCLCGCKTAEVSELPHSAAHSDKEAHISLEAPPPITEILAVDEEKSDQTLPTVLPPKAVIESLNSFSTSLYNSVAEGRSDNLAVSPIGSYILLAMLHAGAEGPAREAIEVNLGMDSSTLHGVSSLVRSLDAVPSLSIAQKIYLSLETSVLPNYLSRVSPLLESPTENVPFLREPRVAVDKINRWVEEKTAGLLKNLLPELPRDTLCVLVSVLHFKGKWEAKFDPKDTTAEHFNLSDGTQVKVPMMHLRAARPLSKTETGTLIALDYTDDTECLLFLPDQGQSPESLLLDPKIGNILNSVPFKTTQIKLELPRFEFKTDTFDLTQAWGKAGLGPLLWRPNLTGMLKVPDPSKPLALQIFHKTYVKVDEEGTEAAAATAVSVNYGSTGKRPDRVLVRFDRPFLFLLRHSKSKAIFMIGRVAQPEIWQGGEVTSESRSRAYRHESPIEKRTGVQQY